jgi:ribonuclease HII
MNPCFSFFPPPASSSPPDTFFYERELYRRGMNLVAGIDEAGRGPLAGPVVAACVILPRDCTYQVFQDSKKLTERRRVQLFEVLQHNGALIGIGLAGPREIEKLNILQASLLAMKRALIECTVASNGCPPDYLLVDGGFRIPVAIDQLTLVKGESKSASVAAASIIAKVTRDRLMAEAHHCYPQFGFHRHQGYPTKEHRQAISCHGPCPLHRRTFRGVKEFLAAATPVSTPSQHGLW